MRKHKRSEEPVLPTERKKVVTDVSKYTLLLYGREKVGKTTVCSQWPDALFLTTEPGTKGLPIFEKEISLWSDMRKAVRALEKDSSRFKTVIIDTVDQAYNMCMAHVCEELGIDYPGEDDQGREDYGKSWRDVRTEFADVTARIIRTGRGLIFTSHARERSIRGRSGETYDRIFPSMSKQARDVVEALVDMFFYCDYARDARGRTVRIFITQGDEVVFAGHRSIAGRTFPPILPMLQEGTYEMFQAALNGEYTGLDPTTLLPSRQTLEPAARRLKTLSRAARSKKKEEKKKRKRMRK